MTVYTATNGAIIADLATLKAIPSTDLPASGFVVLLVAAENSWFEYNSASTSGDVRPVDNPATGYWIRIGRDKLTANRTYYVRTDGSDSNDGLANTSGGAFLTIQKAIDVVASLDISIYDPTIQVANGTYNGQLLLKSPIGSGTVNIVGNIASPANVIITSSSTPTVSSSFGSTYSLKGFTFGNTSTDYKLFLNCTKGDVFFESLIFPAMSGGTHITASGGKAKIAASGTYTVNGSADIHVLVEQAALFDARGKTIILNGTPTFSSGFCYVSACGNADLVNTIYTGSANGARYTGRLNGTIFANGGTLPGSIGGTLSTGAQFL